MQRSGLRNLVITFRLEGMKTYPKGRVCEGEDCSVILSIYNDDTICAKCHHDIDIMELPTTVGQYL